MTSTVKNMDNNGGRGQRRGAQELPRYDQALRAAKNAGKPVRLSLAIETSFTNPEAEVCGEVLEVDKFSIQILTTDGKKPWIAKAMIIGTEVLS